MMLTEHLISMFYFSSVHVIQRFNGPRLIRARVEAVRQVVILEFWKPYGLNCLAPILEVCIQRNFGYEVHF